MSKNIQEFVANYVIAHNKYRDLEIEQLKAELNEILETCDIIKCNICNLYRDYYGSCEFCDIKTCASCDYVQKYSSWNISGCYACDKCEKLYCTGCRETKDKCLHLPMC
jgi:hypothetical protein